MANFKDALHNAFTRYYGTLRTTGFVTPKETHSLILGSFIHDILSRDVFYYQISENAKKRLEELVFCLYDNSCLFRLSDIQGCKPCNMGGSYGSPGAGIPQGAVENPFSDILSEIKAMLTGVYKKPAEGIPYDDLSSAVQDMLTTGDTSALADRISAIEEQEAGWSAKYDLPPDGIPLSDLSLSVRSSLEKADTALQEVPDTYRTAAEQDLMHDATKQDVLISGTNIKTINGNSLLGNGNIAIESGVADFEALENRPKYNGATMTGITDIPQVKTAAWDAKQDMLVSGINIKTINGSSILGTGNIALSNAVSDFEGLENRPKYNGVIMTGATDIPQVKTTVWDAKQDAIADLTDIRSGAALGSTALQSENDPTVPAWAKAATKPSYTAQEVGALPDDTVIPIVPIISTNIQADASSDIKTTSPKAVKSYVDGIVGDIETLLAAL